MYPVLPPFLTNEHVFQRTRPVPCRERLPCAQGKPEEDVKEEPEFSMLAYNQAVAYFSMRVGASVCVHMYVCACVDYR
jgi:hypothetical protein